MCGLTITKTATCAYVFASVPFVCGFGFFFLVCFFFVCVCRQESIGRQCCGGWAHPSLCYHSCLFLIEIHMPNNHLTPPLHISYMFRFGQHEGKVIRSRRYIVVMLLCNGTRWPSTCWITFLFVCFISFGHHYEQICLEMYLLCLFMCVWAFFFVCFLRLYFSC
ncbi:GPI-anchored surface protein, putative [Bodo saltans]|uniref:GPI-anchored surface protein, putative n=1 Tax=Bodo saltans TaxID=75058 RepID=A0A0S4JJX9_BODSA|nr:GPI-anchored surface protein, putative [Bodo saltans]|eukprot:CUG90482.1 GPI-anchored surface protein, putative [Bodo saltans]